MEDKCVLVVDDVITVDPAIWEPYDMLSSIIAIPVGVVIALDRAEKRSLDDPVSAVQAVSRDLNIPVISIRTVAKDNEIDIDPICIDALVICLCALIVGVATMSYIGRSSNKGGGMKCYSRRL